MWCEQCVRQNAVRQMSRTVDGYSRVEPTTRRCLVAQRGGKIGVARDQIHNALGCPARVAGRTTRHRKSKAA